MALIFTLPFPPRECSPNARVHWGVKARAASEYRQTCKVLGRSAYNKGNAPLQDRVDVSITFVLTSKRRRDLDNLVAMFKPGMDGLVDGGLLRDDSIWDIRVTFDAELGKYPGVKVSLGG